MVTTSTTKAKASVSIKDLEIEPSNVQRFAKSHYFFADSKNPCQFRKSDLNRYSAHKELLGDLSIEAWRKVADKGIEILKRSLTEDPEEFDSHTIEITLSKELQVWRADQIAGGRFLPAKGSGLTPLSDACRDLLGVKDFPPALLTNCGVFGAGLTSMLLGAYDPKVLVSNYIVDTMGHYDQGYDRYFSDFDAIIEEALNDDHARSTPGGAYRRDVAREVLRFVRGKNDLEEINMAKLGNRSACNLTRDEVIAFYFCDSAMWGVCSEAAALGADVGALVAHTAITQTTHSVLEIGSDIHNSELFNSFMITADVAKNGGLVTEDLLRRLYDAYSSVGARVAAEECFEPAARVNSVLLCWQMLNSRHNWLRRIVLGYKMIREHNVGFREADFEEAFDENFHTTGFSRPLKNPCNAETVCDKVQALFTKSYDDPLLKELWYYLAEAPLEYGAKGIIDDDREQTIAERCRIALCRAYSYGLTDELTWIIGHATLHAWQVSYLFEASMFGSLLDRGELKGGVDWYQG